MHPYHDWSHISAIIELCINAFDIVFILSRPIDPRKFMMHNWNDSQECPDFRILNSEIRLVLKISCLLKSE